MDAITISIDHFDQFKHLFINYLQDKGNTIDSKEQLNLYEIQLNDNYYKKFKKFIKKYNKKDLDSKYYIGLSTSNDITSVNNDNIVNKVIPSIIIRDEDSMNKKRLKENKSNDSNDIKLKHKKQKIEQRLNHNNNSDKNNIQAHYNIDQNVNHHKRNTHNDSFIKDILVGESSFDRIRLCNALYIDKTEQIYNNLLKKQSSVYYFFVRPRRFGKSLLCSTISNLFGGNSKKKLFKDLWIYNNNVWDFEKENHPVIHLDMSCVTNSNVSKFENAMKQLLNDILSDENINSPSSDLPINAIFSYAIKNIKKIYNGKDVVIIIDEYDKPVLDLIDNPEEMEDVRKSLQTFYSVLKAQESNLRLVFITGLYKFTERTMFSTLNNLNDISLKLPAGTLCGYTKYEISKYFHHHMQAYKLKAHIADDYTLINELKEKYNGYKFGLDTITGEISKSVYNPFAINYIFDDQSKGTDHWYLSGSAKLIAEKMIIEGFNVIDKGVSITMSELHSHIHFSMIDLYALMYYGGYLTIDKYDQDTEELKLKIPNSSIKSMLKKEVFKYIFPSKVKGTLTEGIVIDIYNFLTNTTLDIFKEKIRELEKLYNLLFSGIPYSLLKTEEGFRNIIDFTLRYKFNDVCMEGGVSMGIFDTVIKTNERIYIFEYKYNKSSEAFTQIMNKGYYKSFEIYKLPILLFGVNFKKKDKKAKYDKKKSKEEAVNDYYNNISEIEFEILYP